MRLSYGKLMFENGDTLRIEDSAGTETLVAAGEHDCGKCEFRGICSALNKGNIIARFCAETHFEVRKGKGGHS